MTHFLDTNVCIDILNGLVRKALPDTIAISTMTSFELFLGVEKCRFSKHERAKVENFLQTIPVVPFDNNAAKESAKIRATLEQSGRPIGPYDLLIGGHALSLGLVLVTANMREFSRIPHLSLENWLE